MLAWSLREPGPLVTEPLELVEAPVPVPGPGEVLLKTHYLNVAPVMRMYMMAEGGGESTESVLELGDVIHGRGVAEVLESRHPDHAPGDFVHGQLGWQTLIHSRVEYSRAQRDPNVKKNHKKQLFNVYWIHYSILGEPQ